MPLVPPAPVRFSTKTCRPRLRDRTALHCRAAKSRAPPAASGTIKRTGLVGQGVCASAGRNTPASAKLVVLLIKLRRSIIRISVSVVAPVSLDLEIIIGTPRAKAGQRETPQKPVFESILVNATRICDA